MASAGGCGLGGQRLESLRVGVDREVRGSNPGGGKVFCTHKEKLI